MLLHVGIRMSWSIVQNHQGGLLILPHLVTTKVGTDLKCPQASPETGDDDVGVALLSMGKLASDRGLAWSVEGGGVNLPT